MKREEIKSDPIKDKIVEVINLFVDNSKTVWSIILVIVLGISILTYLNSSDKAKLLERNLNSGICKIVSSIQTKINHYWLMSIKK